MLEKYLKNTFNKKCVLSTAGINTAALFFCLNSESVLQPRWQAADLQGQLREGVHGFNGEVLQNTGACLPSAERGPELHEICEYESRTHQNKQFRFFFFCFPSTGLKWAGLSWKKGSWLLEKNTSEFLGSLRRCCSIRSHESCSLGSQSQQSRVKADPLWWMRWHILIMKLFWTSQILLGRMDQIQIIWRVISGCLWAQKNVFSLFTAAPFLMMHEKNYFWAFLGLTWCSTAACGHYASRPTAAPAGSG